MTIDIKKVFEPSVEFENNFPASGKLKERVSSPLDNYNPVDTAAVVRERIDSAVENSRKAQHNTALRLIDSVRSCDPK